MNIEEIKQKIKNLLTTSKDFKYIIGYTKGTFGCRVQPIFISSPDEVEKLIVKRKKI